MCHRVPLHAESCQLKLGVLTLPRGDNKCIERMAPVAFYKVIQVLRNQPVIVNGLAGESFFYALLWNTQYYPIPDIA